MSTRSPRGAPFAKRAPRRRHTWPTACGAEVIIHKGFETSEMWRWRCTPQSWPDALVASPPMPPSPPPPPSLPPGEYDGGTHGYYAHYTYRPWHVDEPPNHRMSINDELHEAGREAK